MIDLYENVSSLLSFKDYSIGYLTFNNYNMHPDIICDLTLYDSWNDMVLIEILLFLKVVDSFVGDKKECLI